MGIHSPSSGMWASTSGIQSLHVSRSRNQSPALQTLFCSPSGLGSLTSAVSLPWGSCHTPGARGRGPTPDRSRSRRKQVPRHLSSLGLGFTPGTSMRGCESQLQKHLMLTTDFAKTGRGLCSATPGAGTGRGDFWPSVLTTTPSTGQVGGGGSRREALAVIPQQEGKWVQGWVRWALGPHSQSGLRFPGARRGICGRIQSHTCIQYGPASWGSRGARPGQSWSPCGCSPCPRGPLACCNQT